MLRQHAAKIAAKINEDQRAFSSSSSSSSSSPSLPLPSLFSRLSSLLQSLFWVAISLFTLYRGDVINVICHDERTIFPMVFIGLFSWTLMVGDILYLSLILPLILRRKIVNYMEETPNYIFSACLFYIVGFMGLLVGLWPIWGYFTLVLILIWTVGGAASTQLIPDWSGMVERGGKKEEGRDK